jgi:divalent metal cation (Fe/Co/Zn/Cd) transporter
MLERVRHGRRARWIGHRLHGDVSITVPGGLSVTEATMLHVKSRPP